MPNNRFYLTTPIYYVNDRPHIGHAYTTVIADALARYHRLRAEEVRLVTGTDENSQKNLEAMEKAGETDLRTYLDRMSGAWEATWHGLGISFDDFIRTTEGRHHRGVERFWDAVLKTGDLEKRTYEALYCVGCEGFKTETDVNEEKRCPLHPNKDLQTIQEENWFFKLTKYADPLISHIEAHPEFIQPVSRRNEILGYIKAVKEQGLDVSVSREAKKLSVGIPVPNDPDQRIYVWFDALLNYMTAVGYGSDDALFQKFWPADLHLVGKDIIKFHCALWPAMIMSAAKQDPSLRNEDGSPKLPKQVFANGFFTLDGLKISKSLGNAIPPADVAKDVGFDAVRYYLLREITLGEDGDFSFGRLHDRYQNDLGNALGNLLQRTVAMSRKYFDGKVPMLSDAEKTQAGNERTLTKSGHEWQGDQGLQNLKRAYDESMEAFDLNAVLQLVWGDLAKYGAVETVSRGEGIRTGNSGIRMANGYIEATEPFKLAKTDLAATGRVLYALLEALRWYAWLLTPVMPETARKIFVALGLDPEQEYAKGWEAALVWGQLESGTALPEPTPLFPRLEKPAEEAKA